MKAYMQRMGRSLMLPAASLLVGIANWIVGTLGASPATTFLMNSGLAILNNLALLFAVGLALGMSKDKDGAAALAGLVAAAMYNRFSQVKLPMALSFFSGKRLVPIMSAFSMLFVSMVLFFFWPVVYNGLVTFGKGIASLEFVGAGLYGFFNRLLIPTGLHHALNSVFWFDVAGINDIGNFLAGQQALDSGKAVIGQTGMYQAGFFPVMMFGLPAGAFAIYQCARPEKKKITASLMLAAGFAAFFTGVTEPLEFSFMFVAWPLYVLHAVFTGISLGFAAFMQWTNGFAFSAGFVDFFLGIKNPVANQPLMLILQGIVLAFIYYFGFRFAIKKFNLMTPGREIGEGEEALAIDESDNTNKYAALAHKIYEGLGADSNVTAIDNCTTRLRITVKDTTVVDQEKIKRTGVPGVKVISGQNIQVIVGTEVQFVADEMQKLQGKGTVMTENTTAAASSMTTESTLATVKITELYAVAAGKVLPITAVQDEVFSTKMMGDGFAIIPENGHVFAPVAGKITSIFPTKHALGIQTPTGLELLLHMGLDTVELKGAPFTLHVAIEQTVQPGDLIATIDLAALAQAGKASDLIVAFTNQDQVASYELTQAEQTVEASEVIGQVIAK